MKSLIQAFNKIMPYGIRQARSKFEKSIQINFILTIKKQNQLSIGSLFDWIFRLIKI